MILTRTSAPRAVCHTLWRCLTAVPVQIETLDSDWNPKDSETLSGSSDLLSSEYVSSSGNAALHLPHHNITARSTMTALAQDTAARSRDDAAEGTGLAGTCIAADCVPMKKADTRQVSPSTNESGGEEGVADEEKSGRFLEVEANVERFAAVAGLRKFVAGRPWVQHVVADDQTSLDSLVALHKHILQMERRKLVGLVTPSAGGVPGLAGLQGFVESEEYMGVRDGMLFREGLGGLGYYPLAPVVPPSATFESGQTWDLGWGGEGNEGGGGGLDAASPGNAVDTNAGGGKKGDTWHVGDVGVGVVKSWGGGGEGGGAEKKKKVMATVEMVGEDEANDWELDPRFVGEEKVCVCLRVHVVCVCVCACVCVRVCG